MSDTTFTVSAISTWHLIRSAGIVAYLLLTLAAATGLLAGTPGLSGRCRGPAAVVHQAASRWAFWLALFHGLLLMYDSYLPFTLGEVLVPIDAPYRPFATTLGAVAAWGLLVVLVAFDLRSALGKALWRRLHGLTLPVYIAATLHGVLAGTDTRLPAVNAVYVVGAAFVLATAVWYLASHRSKARSQAGANRAEKGGGRLAGAGRRG